MSLSERMAIAAQEAYLRHGGWHDADGLCCERVRLEAALAALPEWEAKDAPVWLGAEEAAAWAAGRNALVQELLDHR